MICRHTRGKTGIGIGAGAACTLGDDCGDQWELDGRKKKMEKLSDGRNLGVTGGREWVGRGKITNGQADIDCSAHLGICRG